MGCIFVVACIIKHCLDGWTKIRYVRANSRYFFISSFHKFYFVVLVGDGFVQVQHPPLSSVLAPYSFFCFLNRKFVSEDFKVKRSFKKNIKLNIKRFLEVLRIREHSLEQMYLIPRELFLLIFQYCVCKYRLLQHYVGGPPSRWPLCLFWRETKQRPEPEIFNVTWLEVGKGTRVGAGQRNSEKELVKGDVSGQSTPYSRSDQSAWESPAAVREDRSRWVGILSSLVKISLEIHTSVSLHMHKGI